MKHKYRQKILILTLVQVGIGIQYACELSTENVFMKKVMMIFLLIEKKKSITKRIFYDGNIASDEITYIAS